MTKEEKAAYNKAYNLANKKKIAENKKAYHLANKEKIKAYRLENKEERNAKSSAWQKANPEKAQASNKAYLLRLNLMNKKISRTTLGAWSLQVRTTQTKCMTCGSTEDLHAHHIAPKVDYPELALLLLNGITLCKTCHNGVHSIT